jgi:hypothetical protein
VSNSPLITNIRSGSDDDPYVFLNELLSVSSGRVILNELPDDFNKVKVAGNNVSWTEIFDVSDFSTIGVNQFYVDYANGIVYFNAINNGLKLYFSYFGRGAIYFPASRVYMNANGNIVDTLKTFIDAIDASDQATIDQLSQLFNDIQTKLNTLGAITKLTFSSVAPTNSDGQEMEVWFQYE